ncbi:MAG: hypothetical protein ACREBD_36605 [Blastocatellia bacterium]
MVRRLLEIIFLVTFAANSLAAITPHVDGEGGCSPDCCQSARGNTSETFVSSLCCMLDCKQSSETSPTTTSVAGAPQQRHLFTIRFNFNQEDSSYLSQARFPSSPSRNIAGSTDRYLETSVLLI